MSHLHPDGRNAKIAALKEELRDHLPPPNPLQTAIPYRHQLLGALQLFKEIIVEKKSANLLRAPAGIGKTITYLQVIRWLYDCEWLKAQLAPLTPDFIPYPFVILTKATAIEQTKRVAEKGFGLSCGIGGLLVTNYDQLRSSFGEAYIDVVEVTRKGETFFEYKWKDFCHPMLIIPDECQGLKNPGAKQTEIMVSYAMIGGFLGPKTYQAGVSATPFTKVSETRWFALAAKIDFDGMKIDTDLKFDHFAKSVAAPSEPNEYNAAAMERAMKYLSPYIIEMSGVRTQFKARNACVGIDFRTEQERAFFNGAWERFMLEVEEIRKRSVDDGRSSAMDERIARLKFRIAGEQCKAKAIAESMYKDVSTGKFAAVAAFNFQSPIAMCVKELIETYGVPRHKISIRWGGNSAYGGGGEEKTYTEQQILEILVRKGRGEKIPNKVFNDIKAQLKSKIDKLDKLPAEWRLGPQSREQGQEEVDRFQRGDSEYCFFTFKSGGVALSLHHTDEWTDFKCRRRPDSNFAFEEDIPIVPTKPRRLYASPTYSPIELVQGLGRCPRLTSLSDTEQTILFYRGTVEMAVMLMVSRGLASLSKVITTREDWSDCILRAAVDRESVKEITNKQIEDTLVEQDEIVTTTESGSDEEDGEEIEDNTL